MLISREDFDAITYRYNLTDGEAENACDFVHELLCAEADLTEEKYPTATVSMNRLNNAAYQVFEVGSDIASDTFGEE